MLSRSKSAECFEHSIGRFCFFPTLCIAPMVFYFEADSSYRAVDANSLIRSQISIHSNRSCTFFIISEIYSIKFSLARNYTHPFCRSLKNFADPISTAPSIVPAARKIFAFEKPYFMQCASKFRYYAVKMLARA